ncbi:hypothetical protein D3C78_1876390 [compost metagenome]
MPCSTARPRFWWSATRVKRPAGTFERVKFPAASVFAMYEVPGMKTSTLSRSVIAGSAGTTVPLILPVGAR